jgi:hypothetical protein
LQFRRGFFVALLVIVCGALLVVGGAISLLMGFDIVMTERGSAMTLGGIIALSGGVIAVGIGFALLRLSQILAALQERNVRGARPVVTADRPVVPLAPAEPVMPADLPVPVVADSSAGRAGVGAGVVAAGLAASAAVAAAGYSSSQASGPDVLASDAGPPQGHAAMDEGLVPMPAMPGPPPLDGASAVAESSPTGASIPDLEEELARALAEPGSAPSPVVAREKSFSDGLSDLLASSRIRKRKSGPDTEVEAEPEAEPEAESGLDAESGPLTDHAPASVERMPSEHVVEKTMDAAEADESLVEPDVPGESSTGAAEDAAVDVLEAEEESTLADGPKTARFADEWNEADLTAAPPTSPALPSRKVLGTYNAGGRTYSMFADGSVEAVTESGVERFSSMDELRRHLVKV